MAIGVRATRTGIKRGRVSLDTGILSCSCRRRYGSIEGLPLSAGCAPWRCRTVSLSIFRRIPIYPNDLEPWQHVFRRGIAPRLTTDQLQLLHVALTEDDPRLLQGSTTEPAPLQAHQDLPCRAACPLAFAFWATGATTVGAVETAFALLAAELDQHFGERGAARYFLNWWDDSDRAHARRTLLAEVILALTTRNLQTPDDTAA